VGQSYAEPCSKEEQVKDLRVQATVNGLWIEVYDGIGDKTRILWAAFLTAGRLEDAYREHLELRHQPGEGQRHMVDAGASDSFETAEEMMLRWGVPPANGRGLGGNR
jgi:hypothetical protein